MNKVTIFGTGYVGLVSGVCLADIGHHVTCVDVDEEKIATLKRGESPIYEPGLTELLTENIHAERILFTTDAAQAVQDATIIMSAVGTPPMEDGSADLQYVLNVARTVARHMNEYKVIITKSTVPVGTGEKVEKVVREVLAERGVSYDFDVVSNPEFLKEGSAVADFQKPDRIIVGTESERAITLITELYKPLMRSENRLMFMDRPSAELTKYAANALLATKISFMNELSRLAEDVGADIENVRRGIGSDPRIGKHFIYPGPGYGGSCFPKDVQALAKTEKARGLDASILDAVEKVNGEQPLFFAQKIVDFYDGDLTGKIFAFWGLAFKEETDDVRVSPAQKIIEVLIRSGAKIQAYDPEAMETFQKFTEIGTHENISYVDSEYKALESAQALVIATPWKQFRAPDFERIADMLTTSTIFDGRNLYAPEDMKLKEFTYLSIGRQDILSA